MWINCCFVLESDLVCLLSAGVVGEQRPSEDPGRKGAKKILVGFGLLRNTLLVIAESCVFMWLC